MEAQELLKSRVAVQLLIRITHCMVHATYRTASNEVFFKLTMEKYVCKNYYWQVDFVSIWVGVGIIS
jgi:hypothetical protein